MAKLWLILMKPLLYPYILVFVNLLCIIFVFVKNWFLKITKHVLFWCLSLHHHGFSTSKIRLSKHLSRWVEKNINFRMVKTLQIRLMWISSMCLKRNFSVLTGTCSIVMVIMPGHNIRCEPRHLEFLWSPGEAEITKTRDVKVITWI